MCGFARGEVMNLTGKSSVIEWQRNGITGCYASREAITEERTPWPGQLGFSLSKWAWLKRT